MAEPKQVPKEPEISVEELRRLRFKAVKLVMENGSVQTKTNPFDMAQKIVNYTTKGEPE